MEFSRKFGGKHTHVWPGSDSKLSKSSIVAVNKNSTYNLSNKVKIISDSFADDMLNLDEDISEMIKDAVRPCDKSSLNLKDYEHISKDIDIVMPYLKNAIETKAEGVNILFYGLPGTGKTELVKTISQALKTKLFEISYANEDNESIDGHQRLKAFKVAQALLSNQNILLMYDEA
ncbi:MAG TPA: AAA family ATPase, partial [Campylobacterales bacterium]|nr:AAA family ATPase [Campylobacterales bacterium]